MLRRVLPQAFRGELGTEDFWVVDVKANQTPLALQAAVKLEERHSAILKRVKKADEIGKSSVIVCKLAVASQDQIEKALESAGIERPYNTRVLTLVSNVPVMEVHDANLVCEGYGRKSVAFDHQD